MIKSSWPQTRDAVLCKRINLIEILIVLAILTILLSLLFPAIKGAVEKSRRVSCVSNIKQHYSMWVVYTDDHHDLMPYAGVADVNLYMSLNFQAINSGGYGALHHYYREYLGLKFTWNQNYLMRSDTIAQCPSGLVNSFYEADHHYTSPLARPGYLVPGLGVFSPGTGAGEPRMSKMSAGGPEGPVIFMLDVTSNYLTSATAYGKNMNHAEQGGNVCMSNGSVSWYDITYFGPYGYPLGIPAYLQYPAWDNVNLTTAYFKGVGQTKEVRKLVYGYYK